MLRLPSIAAMLVDSHSLQYGNRVRSYLQTTNRGVDQIAAMVGYADGVTLRTLLRWRLGKGIREIKGA